MANTSHHPKVKLSTWSRFIRAPKRSSHPEMFLGKGVLKICSKFTGEHECRSAISINCKATLLKSDFGMGVLLLIRNIFSEQLFLRTLLGGCFCPIYQGGHVKITLNTSWVYIIVVCVQENDYKISVNVGQCDHSIDKMFYFTLTNQIVVEQLGGRQNAKNSSIGGGGGGSYDGWKRWIDF